MSWRSRSYEVLPALSLRGPELRKSLRIVTLSWSFGIIWMICIAGSRVNVFGRMLGFTNFDFGLLTSLAFLATFGQLVAAIWIERTGLRKQQFLYFGSVHRLLWLAVAAIPLVAMLPFVPDLPARWAVWTMLLTLLASSFTAALSNPAWWTWMGDVIPRRIRGRYFAIRGRITRAVQIPAVIGLAVWLDHVAIDPDNVSAATEPVLLASICVIFAAAAAIGTIDILLFRRVREVIPTTPARPRQPAIDIRVDRPRGNGIAAKLLFAYRYVGEVVRQVLVDPLTDRVFRRYVIFGSTITFGMTVAGPFFWRHMLENLRISQLGVDFLFMVVGPIVALVAVKGWGKLVDRWGRRPVLILGSSLTVFSILPYFFAAPQTPNPQFVIDGANWLAGSVGHLFGQEGWRWLSSEMPVGAWLVMAISLLFGGMGWSGINLAQNGIILGFSDGHGRSKYVAASAVLISLGGVAGGLIGGTVAQALQRYQDNPIIIGPFLWNNWHATFLLAWVARIIALLLVIGMPDPGSRKVRDLFRFAGENVYNYVSTGLFYRLRVFGWGRVRRNRKQGGGRQ